MPFKAAIDKIGKIGNFVDSNKGTITGITGIGGALAGGLGLLNRDPPNVGYQGGIPDYTAVRGRVPYETMDPEGRRPGQAGRRYFTDVVYAQSPENQGMPTLEQAQQQVADQTQSILNRETFDRPIYEQEPPPATQPQLSIEEIMNILQGLNRGVTGAGLGEVTPVTGGVTPMTPEDEARLVQGAGTMPVDAGPRNLVQEITNPNISMWHYNSQGKLVREVPSGNVYRVNTGDGNFETYSNREDAEAALSGTRNFAKGGLASLGKTFYLGGSTDGMADEVPAKIEGTQEARLSDGEFVLPADVVSHIGNGNSNAGAKELYDMMDRIRQARTGKKSQGREVNAQKILPV